MQKYILSIGLLLIFVLASCSPEKGIAKIGVILPLSGNQATYGQGISEGLNLALDELKDNQKIELIYEDNGGDVKNTVTAALKLINVDNVVGLITGPSQHSVAVAPIAEEDKIVLYTMASQASKLNSAGDYIFKNDGDFRGPAEELAELIFDKGHRTAGVIYATYNDATVDAKDAFEKKFIALGGEVVAVEGFGKDESDFKNYLTKIDTQEPTAIFVNGLVKDASIILKQIAELGLKQDVFGQSGIEDQQVINSAGQSAEGVIFTTFNPILSETFKQKVQERYGHAPLRWTVEAYDGLNIVVKAITNVEGEITSEKLKEELSKIKVYVGESGKIEFDNEGNAIRPILTKIIKDGKFELYTN